VSEQCSHEVMDDTGWHITNCSRKATATEDDKPVCWQHSKAAIEARRRKSHEDYEARMAGQLAPYNKITELKATNAKLLVALKGLSEALTISTGPKIIREKAIQAAWVQACEAIKEAEVA